MLKYLKKWLTATYAIPVGYKHHRNHGFIGSLSGSWHIRQDCQAMGACESNAKHHGLVIAETYVLMVCAFFESVIRLILWVADLTPHIIKWGVILVVGIALAAGIGLGLAVDVDASDIIALCKALEACVEVR